MPSDDIHNVVPSNGVPSDNQTNNGPFGMDGGGNSVVKQNEAIEGSKGATSQVAPQTGRSGEPTQSTTTQPTSEAHVASNTDTATAGVVQQEPLSPGTAKQIPPSPQPIQGEDVSAKPEQQTQQPQLTEVAGVKVYVNPSSDGSTQTPVLNRWRCSKCGTIIESFHSVEKCPKCGANSEFFIDAD